jgi:hypothetical protein
MNPRNIARALTGFALLALIAPAPSAHTAAAQTLAVSVSVAASCVVGRAKDVATTRNVADLVTVEFGDGALNVEPQVSASDPITNRSSATDTTHHVVTIHF